MAAEMLLLCLHLTPIPLHYPFPFPIFRLHFDLWQQPRKVVGGRGRWENNCEFIECCVVLLY